MTRLCIFRKCNWSPLRWWWEKKISLGIRVQLMCCFYPECRKHAQKQRLAILPALFTKTAGLCAVCLWIFTMHHWGMQGSVNVCRLPFFLNNPFGTSSHVELRSKWAVCDPRSVFLNVVEYFFVWIFCFDVYLRAKCIKCWDYVSVLSALFCLLFSVCLALQVCCLWT